MLPTASSPMAQHGSVDPATMDPNAPTGEKLARAEQHTACESRVQPPELEDKGSALPRHLHP